MDIGIIPTGESSRCSAEAASEPFGICIQKSQPGSELLKHQRSASFLESWWPTKIPKADDVLSPGISRSGCGISENKGQTMISFSSQPQISHFPNGDGAKASTFPFLLCLSDPLYSRTTSYHAAMSGAGIRGPFSRFRGPFTPSQWMELEHQAMIYKHLMSNIPVPTELLIPLRKAFKPRSFSCFSNGYTSNSFGWGSFHLGFGSSSDPEPGRCRRTDGKKWRCSRDVVPDQKYCERHLNRGRHRSRKPVEGQPGHAVSGFTASKVAPHAISSAVVMSTSSASDSLDALQHRFSSLQPKAPDRSADQLASSRLPVAIPLPEEKMQKDIFKSKETEETPLSTQKQHTRFGGSLSEFGLVSPDSFHNPSQRSPGRNSDSLLGFKDQEEHHEYPLRHFIDDWPKDQSNQASSWPEELKLDWTQLSMSIPVSSSDFSSLDSPQLAKPEPSHLKLSHELETTKMGLNIINEPNQIHKNWLPISWADPVGGPLGEALNGAPSIAEGLNSPDLSLITNTWDNHPQLGCSPTAVLQRSAFISCSNRSPGYSPGAANRKASEGTGLRGAILGATLVNSASVPYA